MSDGGITPSERRLASICRRSFLSLWSYPNVYRRQGLSATQLEGKELCDVLVVCGDDVIIFSDKACAFPATGSLQLDWSRWFRKTILQSANQIWGAERWIRQFPAELFLDKKCTRRLPVPLPESARARVHRVVVAHDPTLRSRAELGGSGTLILMPHIVGKAHLGSDDDPATPFAIGQIDPTRGFVHVLDSVSLRILLNELDTITDLTWYLTRKERLIESGKLGAAAGEEELLAYYLQHGDPDSGHDFAFPKEYNHLVIDVGLWKDFQINPRRLAKKNADQISYCWDQLIEKFAYHLLNGTSISQQRSDFGPLDEAVRYLAKEPRVRRRILAGALVDLVNNTKKSVRNARFIGSKRPEEPSYVFVVLSRSVAAGDEEYRETRRALLEAYCLATKAIHRESSTIIGIATEPEGEANRSEDLVVLSPNDWGEKEYAEAEATRQKLGLFKHYNRMESAVEEYPKISCSNCVDGKPRRGGRIGRNEPCPCGSGRKFKRCCGQR